MQKILFIILLSTSSLFSQIDSIQNLRIKELKQNVRKSNSSVYIKSQIKENNDLIIFLINESKDTLKIETESRDKYYINFNKEVLNKSNNWITEIPNIYCLILDSSYTMKIPPNHYTWEKVEDYKYLGDYKTKMRVSLKIDSENTISKEIELSYNSDLFLPKNEQYLKQINKILSSDSNLSKKEKINFLIKKSELYIKMNEFKKSYILCDSIEKTELNNERIRFSKAKSFNRFVSANLKKTTELERLGLISKNINLYNNIQSTNERINNRVNSYLKTMNSLLLSKKEFDEKFQKNNETNLVEIDFIGTEKVKILFKEEN